MPGTNLLPPLPSSEGSLFDPLIHAVGVARSRRWRALGFASCHCDRSAKNDAGAEVRLCRIASKPGRADSFRVIMTNPHDPIWSEAGQGIRFDKPNRSQLPMVVFPCRSHHLTELYTRENQCDNLLLHHHHQHHHHLRTCFAFVWLEVIASRSKLLSQHCSVGGMSWTGLHQHRI